MLLIKNGRVITMGEKDYACGDILIDNGKILSIGENLSYKGSCEVLDVDGAWVLPGFIDAHCHMGMFESGMGFEGNDGNEDTDPVTPQLRAIDGINPLDSAYRDAVKAGITTVMTGPGSANVIGGQFVAMKTAGIRVEDMVLLEPAAMKIAFGENPKRVYSKKNKMPATRMGTAAVLRETLYNAQKYKRKKREAEIKGEDFEEDFKMEALMPVINKNIPLKAHAHRADDLLTALRIAREFDLKITLEHVTEGHLIADLLAEEKVSTVLGPALTFSGKIETKEKSFKTPNILFEKGVKIAIMTDHPVIPIQYLPLCASLAVKEGLPMMEGLKAITINAAEICGIDDRVGSIEVGKDADITVFNGNPLEIFTKTLYTIIDGKIVYRD